jgi:hypothetical protein
MFLGGPLQEDYHIHHYKNLCENFKYQKKPYQNTFVIVEKIDDKYFILEGI